MFHSWLKMLFKCLHFIKYIFLNGFFKSDITRVISLPVFCPWFQLMAQVCMDLTLCLLALLLGETSSAITHLLHIVAGLHNCGHFSLMQAVCRLMLPPGALIFILTDTESKTDTWVTWCSLVHTLLDKYATTY